MSIQVHAHGFSLSDSLKEACLNEIRHRIEPLVRSELHVRWNLHKDGHDWVAFLSWHEKRNQRGNVRIRSDDLYKSISIAGKVAAEQVSEQHHKQNPKARRNARAADCLSVESGLSQ